MTCGRARAMDGAGIAQNDVFQAVMEQQPERVLPGVGKDEKNTSKRKCIEKKETIPTTSTAKGSSRRNSISSPKSKTKTKKQNMEKELDIPTGTEASFEDLWRKLAKRKWSLITIRGQTRFCLPHCPSGSNLRAAREEAGGSQVDHGRWRQARADPHH